MRKIKLKDDVYVPGWGTVRGGTEFKVERYNSRFVYIKLGKCEFRLARSRVEKVY